MRDLDITLEDLGASIPDTSVERLRLQGTMLKRLPSIPGVSVEGFFMSDRAAEAAALDEKTLPEDSPREEEVLELVDTPGVSFSRSEFFGFLLPPHPENRSTPCFSRFIPSTRGEGSLI